jgi:type I restriction-modification system DNA methylase subunit
MKKTLWEAADKLRAQMDAAEYKHLVLGLIFLKYVSDSFDERRREVAGKRIKLRVVDGPSRTFLTIYTMTTARSNDLQPLSTQ